MLSKATYALEINKMGPKDGEEQMKNQYSFMILM